MSLKAGWRWQKKKANELKRQINWNNLKNRKGKRKKKNRVSVTCGTIFNDQTLWNWRLRREAKIGHRKL